MQTGLCKKKPDCVETIDTLVAQTLRSRECVDSSHDKAQERESGLAKKKQSHGIVRKV